MIYCLMHFSFSSFSNVTLPIYIWLPNYTGHIIMVLLSYMCFSSVSKFLPIYVWLPNGGHIIIVLTCVRVFPSANVFHPNLLADEPIYLWLPKWRSHNYGSIVLHEFFLQRLTSDLLVDEPIYVWLPKYRSHNHVLHEFFLQRLTSSIHPNVLVGEPICLTTKYRSHNHGSIVLLKFFLQLLTSSVLIY